MRRSTPRRALAAVAGSIVAAALLLGAGVLWWSGATLSPDSSALARVGLQPLAGAVSSVRVTDADGNRVPTSLTHGTLVPQARLASGERLSVVVTVRRPGWLGWAIGRTTTEQLSLVTPEPVLRQRWLTVGTGERLALHFSTRVERVSYHEETGAHGVLEPDASTVLLDRGAASSGTVRVRVSARTWERLGSPVTVTWFPQSQLPVARVSPAPGATISPREPVRFTFSEPLAKVFGGHLPKTPAAGVWTQADSHTLVFAPGGFGLPFASDLSVALGTRIAVSSGSAAPVSAKTVSWHVVGAQFLRLQQLLAQAGYLPLVWNATGEDVPRQVGDEVDAAVKAPAGRFLWRYSNTPHELARLWVAGQPNEITRGAVMMFEHDRGLAVDGIAGAQVWRSLLAYALSGHRRSDGYSYVYVHRNVPQLLTLWHNGSIVLTSPGNTGVPAAPTALGTFPVFEHIPVGRMSGRNPDGSHYDDPGIRWISYFHGGEALHAFNRASFGTPQSLGCVELPLETAARVWPYTPIGTLVTIED